MTPARIYLIGLMGAGKSTVGKLLAKALSWQLIDLDAEIESSAMMSIHEIFENEGEPAFRERESAVLEKTLTRQQVVVACGGGVVTRKKNCELLRSEVTVWLDLSPTEAAKRLEHSENRPLLSECEDTVLKLNEILTSRGAAYEDAARVRVNSGGLSPENVVSQIIKEIEALNV